MAPPATSDLPELLNRIGRRAFSYALQWLGDREDALDAVQTAMLACWEQRAKLQPERNPSGWFYRILRNKCIDQLRRRRARTELPDALPDHDAARPDAATLAADQAAQLRQALAALPAEQREIVLLRDYHDLDYAALARVLEIPPGTVMSRLHRARTALRFELAQLEEQHA